jgi:hypothetical protein
MVNLANQMTTLDILKRLERRRKKRVEINKSMTGSILYQADLRKQIDREQMRAERDKIKGHMSRMGSWQPHIMRVRYAELQAALDERGLVNFE